MKNRGQALVEAVILAPLLFALIFFFGFYIFELLSRVILSHLADKAVICETAAPRTPCKNQFRMQLEKFSRQLRLQSYTLKRSSRVYTLRIAVGFPLNRRLEIEKKLPWSERGPL